MKLQLNTTDHIIKIEDRYVNLNELCSLLEKILPNGEWREYDLECGNTLVWQSSPVIIEKHIPSYPWLQPTYDPSIQNPYTTCTTIPGVYNLEIEK